MSEIIATVLQKGIATKAVWEAYNPLIEKFGTELNILIKVSFDELKKVCDERIAKLIIDLRERTIRINPGYDGVYGNIDGFANPDADEDKEDKTTKKKKRLKRKQLKLQKLKKLHQAIKTMQSRRGFLISSNFCIFQPNSYIVRIHHYARWAR